MAFEKLKDTLPTPLLVASIKIKDVLRPNPDRDQQMKAFKAAGNPDSVLFGPFKGMKYLPESRGWRVMPKLLGVYERELHPALENAITWNPDVIIDVGTAEGYYAVGLQIRLPNAKAIGYDTDRYAVHLLKKNAKLNHVESKLDIRGFCDTAELQKTLSSYGRPLILCDCEGYESVLLNPDKAPALAKAMIIVELHDQFSAGVSELIEKRFEKTHNIEIVHTQPRTTADWTAVNKVDDALALDVMDERRQIPMRWFVLTPR